MATGVDERQDLQFQLARERLALYFRSLGFDDPAVETAIRTVRERLPPALPDASDAEIARQASEEALSLVQERLTETAPSSRGLPGQMPAPALWRLPTKLRQQPDGPGDADHPAERMARLLRESCRPILPPEKRASMFPQPLGAVPSVLQPAFWRRTTDRLITNGRKVVRLLSVR